jgi:hypothetical protein
VGHSIARVGPGHFLVTGYTSGLGAEADDPYLIKVNDEGETVWTRVLALEGSNHTLTGVPTADGGLALVGFSVFQQSNAGLFVKTDQDGQLQWSKDFLSTSAGQTLGYTVRATPDGGCVLTGHTTEGSAGDLDVFIAKSDANGNLSPVVP